MCSFNCDETCALPRTGRGREPEAHSRRARGGFCALLVCLLLCACNGRGEKKPDPEPPKKAAPVEHAVVEIALEGDAAQRDIEYSGMAWFGDHLVLLPQYPGKFENRVFAIPKADLLKAAQGGAAPLTPKEVPFDGGGASSIEGFEGFEAIVFEGEQVFVTIETTPGHGYLMRGTMDEDLGGLTLVGPPVGPVEPQAKVDNMSYESLLVWPGNGLMTFFEANGAKVNAEPAVKQFKFDMTAGSDVPMASIEYRITDVSAMDGSKRFWAINYWYPGDTDLATDNDPIVAEYGEGATHQKSDVVERLVELELGFKGVAMTDTPPIQLRLAEDGRNWEGIVRLDDLGFLIVTDKFPETILGFVPRRVSPR